MKTANQILVHLTNKLVGFLRIILQAILVIIFCLSIVTLILVLIDYLTIEIKVW